MSLESWGGQVAEDYQTIFDLSPPDLEQRIAYYGPDSGSLLTKLPLPFEDFHFDLVLSDHYLFFKTGGLDEPFHLRLIKELCRIGKELRIFPLTDHLGAPSPLLGPILLALQRTDYGVELRSLPPSLQRQGEGRAMLRVFALTCPVSPCIAI